MVDNKSYTKDLSTIKALVVVLDTDNQWFLAASIRDQAYKVIMHHGR